jgi:hypothetical protein
MFKWLLFPVLTADVKELEKGLLYRTIRLGIQSRHPEGAGLNAGNITQALNSVPALRAKKNIKPFILDYDRSNLRLSVVDKGFLIWLASGPGQDDPDGGIGPSDTGDVSRATTKPAGHTVESLA